MNAKERSSLEIYIDELSKADCSALDIEKELELLERASEGDREAQNKIIKSNLRFVVSVAKKFVKRGILLDDLVQAGNIALFESFESFDYEKFIRSGCCRFISYAGRRIAQKIALEAKKSLPLSITTGKFKELKKIQSEFASMGYDYNDREGLCAVADSLGLNQKRVQTLYEASLETISYEQSSSPDQKSIEEKLGDSSFSTPEDEAILNVSAVELKKNLSKLDSLEEEVITLAYGLDGHAPLNYPAIGARIGYTREGVRLVHNRAINHLRECMGLAA